MTSIQRPASPGPPSTTRPPGRCSWSPTNRGPTTTSTASDPATGDTRWRTDAERTRSDPRVEQQRGALALAGRQIYVAYGALEGDCGDYHGEVVTAATSGTVLRTLSLPTERGGGIWAPSGPTVDKAGHVYVTSANSAANSATDTYEDSNGTLRLTPMLQVADYFAAADWYVKDREDLGQGSTGPTVLDDGLIVTVGKDLPNYVLSAGSLGHVGGQLATSPVCAGYGGTAHVGDVVYLPCQTGTTAVRVDRSGLHVLWRAADAGLTGAPVTGGGAVFVLDPDSGRLAALATGDGHQVGTVTLPAVTTRFATPALWGSMLFVGTVKGIVAIGGG